MEKRTLIHLECGVSQGHTDYNVTLPFLEH